MVPRIILRGDQESAGLKAREGMRQLDILKNLMSFGRLKQDVRRVRYIDGSEIVCRSIFGIDDVQIYVPEEISERETVLEQYVYVTISDYVTIWDLGTGEVAENIYDKNNKLVMFPCHKDKLVPWLKGIKDRPTRQIPGMEDNEMDAGNENRIPTGEECKKGVSINANFTSQIESGITCVGIPEEYCLDPWFLRAMGKYYFEGGIAKNIRKSIHPNGWTQYPNSWQMSCNSVSYKDGYRYCYNNAFCSVLNGDTLGNDTRNVEKYDWRTREFHLQPSNVVGKTPNELILLECDVFRAANDLDKHTYECNAWGELDARPANCPYPVHVSCRDDVAGERSTSYVFSYRTPMGNLVTDLIPTRKLKDKFENIETYQSIQEIINSEGYIEKYPDIYIEKNNLEELGLSHYINNAFPLSHVEDPFLLNSNVFDLHLCNNSLGCEQLPIPNYGGYSYDKVPISCFTHPVTFNDAKITKTISGKYLGDDGIDDRYAVSWCESPKEKNEDWYKVHLFFNMGKVFCRECNKISDWRNEGVFCEWPDTSDIREYYIGDRFSSAQATIELEHPEKYRKQKDIPIEGKATWVKRYKRPDDYSKAGVFPGRESGYPEDENSCFPFDGTYDIYTLGEAVEELINNYYKDGSNDQLLVYLLSKPTIRKIP